MWSEAVVDNIARKVAEEPMDDVPQQAQMEMYDDPYLNWSGHR